MKNRFFSGCLLARQVASLGCLLALGSSAVAGYLNIGDPAPELHPAQWLKGDAIDRFESNHVYVVEFWATWCTPCKANIPHLTEVAHKFKGRAAVIGVSIWENPDPKNTNYLAKVAQFVQSEGDKMDYHVAVDVPRGDIANGWVKAAGEGGIPVSFIIGKDGHIAWIGYPLELDGVLDQVLADKFDVAAARRERDQKLAPDHALKEAFAANNYQHALELIDQMIAAKPEQAPAFEYDRLMALFHTDVPAAMAQANEILEKYQHDIGKYQMIASIFAAKDDLSPAAYEFGQKLIDTALKKEDREYLFLAMKAQVRLHLHDRADAIKYQEAAVTAAEKDSHAPASFVEFLRKQLADFKAGI